MALNDITIVDSGNKVYSPISVGSMAVVRQNTATALSTPEQLEISHQLGSQTKPDRHLVKFTRTEQDGTDASHFETASCHLVVSLPRTVNSVEDVVDLFRRMYIYLEGGTADFDNLRAICNGSLG